MGYLTSDSYAKYYYINKCSSSFLFLMISYAAMVLGPFFMAKQSGDYWSFTKTYYEQPHVNFDGKYIVECLVNGERKTISNIGLLENLNSENSVVQMNIQKNDYNLDTKYDDFTIDMKMQFNGEQNNNIQNCQIYLMALYGLRDRVKLQMISPLHFDIKSPSGIQKSVIQGQINLQQTNSLLAFHTLRQNYFKLNTIDMKKDDLSVYSYINEMNNRNETLYSSYNYYTLPGNSATFTQFQFNLQVPQVQPVLYTPHLLENIKFLYIQYIAIFIPIIYVGFKIIQFIMRNRIFHSNIEYDIPKERLHNKWH